VVNMPELLSLRGYAALRKARGLSGGSLAAVQKAIASNRITPIAGKIDPEVADIQWHRKTDPVQQQRGNGGHPSNGGAGLTVSPGDQPAMMQNPGFLDAKVRTEKVRAQLLELELAEKSGALISADQVRQATFEKARISRDAIMAIPARLSSQLAAEMDPSKVHDLLTVELRKVCAELAAGEAGQARN
jgi:hypothetical protein